MKFVPAAAVAAALILSACGGGSSHATCTDNAKTSEYMSKFLEDVTNAATSGKITQEQSEKAQMDLMRYKGDPDDMGALCTWADEQRKTLGL